MYNEIEMIKFVKLCREGQLRLCNICGKTLESSNFSEKSDSGTCKQCARNRTEFYSIIKNKELKMDEIRKEVLNMKIKDCQNRIMGNEASISFARMIGNDRRTSQVEATLSKNKDALRDMLRELQGLDYNLQA